MGVAVLIVDEETGRIATETESAVTAGGRGGGGEGGGYGSIW